MKKEKNRLLSYVLILAMILTFFPNQRIAAEDVQDEYVDVIYELNQDDCDEQGIKYTVASESAFTATVLSDDAYQGANNGVVTIPDYVEKDGYQYSVDGFNYKSFQSNKNILKLCLPNKKVNLQSIALDNSAIETVQLKEKSNFDMNPFCYCPQLKTIEVSEKSRIFKVVDDILYYDAGKVIRAFPRGKQVDTVTIPTGVTKIDFSAFEYANIRKVILPETVKTIEDNAFYNSKVEVINLDKVEKFGLQAFCRCAKLKRIQLDSCKTMEGIVFSDCNALKAVYVPGDIVATGYFDLSLLSGCQALECVVVGNCTSEKMPVKAIGNSLIGDSFSECSNLSTLILPDTLTNISDLLYNCSKKLEKLYLPKSISTYVNPFESNESGLTVYGFAGTKVEELSQSRNFKFEDISNHTHTLTDKVLYEDEYMRISAKYCEECGYATDCKQEILKSFLDDGTNEVVTGPAISVTPTPTASPTVEPATPTPTASPTVEPATPTPTASPTVEPATPTPTASPTVEPATPTPIPATLKPKVISVVPKIQKKSITDSQVKITFARNTKIAFYQIYRSQKANGTFKFVKKVSESKKVFLDKGVIAGSTYFYRIRPVLKNNVNASAKTVLLKQKIKKLIAPVFKLYKNSSNPDNKFITLKLVNYAGEYIQVMINQRGKKYNRLNLVSDLIATYKRKIRIKYLSGGKRISFKIRTYRIVGKKKIYSSYSKIKRIRI